MEIMIKLKDILQCAHYFWEHVQGKVFAFHGEMGSGKTTFITALCVAKGVKSHISSPTFSLVNEYTYTDQGVMSRIFHIDLYRLKDEAEAINAGIEDCLYSENICFVEWPEKACTLLPLDTVDIYIYPVNNDTRVLKIDFSR